MSGQSYEKAGVKGQGEALSSIVRHLGPTLALPDTAAVLTDFGGYASVLKVSEDLAIAISTDGVGTKTLIASAMDRYDTIGFDCMAMNVNDIICVGARPIAMVDYLGVHTLDETRLEEILRGLGAAAKEAGVAIPGGELAQLPEVIGSDGKSPGDETAFDLVGTCIGTLHPDDMILGRSIRAGDALIGIASSGIHSNGLTLARTVLLKGAGYRLGDEIGRLGCTLGEELLRPTEIYVRAATSLWDVGIETKGLVHITSDGFTNLCRLEAEVGYDIDSLPPVPEIFKLIKEAGDVPDAEMHRVFNMGVGLVVVVPQEEAARAIVTLSDAGYRATAIGRTDGDVGTVNLREAGLVGRLDSGESTFTAL
ncbi:MAG: phosphoribosylformylglycinamidine cyclo-ligase [Actinobacteria bacterium]|nr:phosphoribosylformylglycinamidine cyclo-ligase [Actinomycetota bacterium]